MPKPLASESPEQSGAFRAFIAQQGLRATRQRMAVFEGARTIRVQPIDSNRYPSVAILDLRLDKSLDMGKFGKIQPMLDVFNIMNSGVPTSIRTTNTATAPFNDVTAILNPRVIRFGVRFSF